MNTTEQHQIKSALNRIVERTPDLGPTPDEFLLRRPETRSNWQPLIAVAAATVVLVGVGVLAANQPGPSDTTLTPASQAEQPQSSHAVPDNEVADTVLLAPADTPAQSNPPGTNQSTEADAQISADENVDATDGSGPFVLADGTRFAVVDVVPTGWNVVGVDASPGGSMFGSQQWALLDEAGAVSGVVDIRPPRPVSADEASLADDEFDSTVRGMPADEWTDDPAASGSPTPRAGITWYENSYQMQVSATGAAQELARPIAESLVVDDQARTVTITDEFGLIPAGELGLTDPAAVATSIRLAPSWTGPGLLVYSEPNRFGYDLNQLVGTGYNWEPVQIDGRSAVAGRNPSGAIAIISWLDGDMQVTMSSTLAMANDASALSDEELLDVARGVRFADSDEFLDVSATVAEGVNNEVAGWALYDQASTSDGIEASVRTSPDHDDGHALCLDAPVFDCILVDDDGGFDEAHAAKGFDLGDRRIGVVWISASIDAQTGDPTLRPSDHLNPADRYTDGTTATIISDTTTDHGRFVIVTIPDGEPPPTVGFITDDGPSPRVELTPNLDQ